MSKILSFLSILLLLGSSCFLKKKTNGLDVSMDSDNAAAAEETILDAPLEYQAARPLHWKLVSTALEVEPVYEKSELEGSAQICLEVQKRPQDSLWLDAKYMFIQAVDAFLQVKKGKDKVLSLRFDYKDSLHLKIYFGEAIDTWNRIVVKIKYTARPNAVKQVGSAAISDAKGIYFINPLGEDPSKPRQVWTQGETESSSCWFPTIDAPNQKMSQSISITCDTGDVTVSNGDLVYSSENGAKRTDMWQQSQTHAPYLAMMAIGKFAKVKDQTEDGLAVNYFVEPKWQPYAKLVFGKTPAMIEFFSKKFVPYPWEKYDQIVVRDYVSGAMENTTAVIHEEMMQHDARAHLDNTGEDVISHELFHHWFGDLVTCESWSNLSLNESFATYGEYLWREHAYGKEDAEHHMMGNMEAFIHTNVNELQPPIVRYYYRDKEDMFDVNSYQRGGAVLNMLRNLVGDEIFFESLQLYLKSNMFGTAEIHDLRKCFEKISGEDLNWFFNQWFLETGHPEIAINQIYDDSTKTVEVDIAQIQVGKNFTFPLTIKVHGRGFVNSHKVWVKNGSETFTFPCDIKPFWVQVDADRTLLCTRTEERTVEERKYQFAHGGNYYDKQEALEMAKIYLNSTESDKAAAAEMLTYALGDGFWAHREQALQMLLEADDEATVKAFESKITELATKDAKASVRLKAIQVLARLNDVKFASIFEHAINDLSYRVCDAGMNALYKFDSAKVLQTADLWFATDNRKLNQIAFGYLVKAGKGSYGKKLLRLLPTISFQERFSYLGDMATYLSGLADTTEAKVVLEAFKGEFYCKGVPNYYAAFVRMRLAQSKETIEASLTDKTILKETKDERIAIKTLIIDHLAAMKLDQALIKLFDR